MLRHKNGKGLRSLVVHLHPVVHFFLGLIVALYPAVGSASELEVASLLVLLVLLLLKFAEFLWGACRARCILRHWHICGNFGLQLRCNQASSNLLGHVLAKASILQLIHHAGFRYQTIECGKVEHNLASVASLEQNILLLIDSNECQNLLSKEGISRGIVINLNQEHDIQLTLSFEIQNIETSSIGVVLVRVIHEAHQNLLETHKVYLSLVFLAGEFEIEYFCITITGVSKKRREIFDHALFRQDVTRELSFFSLVFKFSCQLFESSL